MNTRTVADVMSGEPTRSAMPLEEFARASSEHHRSAASTLDVDDLLPTQVDVTGRRHRWWLLRRLPSRTVGQVMFTRPSVIRPDAELAEAMRLMTDRDPPVRSDPA